MKINLRSCFPPILCLLASWAAPAFAQGTAFTYQGRLTDGTNAANGNYDLRFSLRDALVAGNAVGSTNALAPVTISNGLFVVTLDFGAGIFTGPARWLEIGVRTNGSVAAYVTLIPRQPVTPSPYAIMAGNAVNLGGQPSTAFAPVSGSSTYVAKTGDTMTGALNLLGTNAVVGFGSQTRQMLNLYDFSTFHYGIGVQNSTLYQRAASGGAGFAWYAGGVHNDGQNNPGGGTTLMLLDGSGNLSATGAGSFNGGANDGVYGVSSGGNGVHGVTSSATQAGVAGVNTGNGYGVAGFSDAGGTGVYGRGTLQGVYGIAANGNGVKGETTTGVGVWGTSSGAGEGVYGSSSSGIGVHGRNTGGGLAGYFEGDVNITDDLIVGTSATTAIEGVSSGQNGVYGSSSGANGNGVHGVSTGANGDGVYGVSSSGNGVHGVTSDVTQAGVAGVNTGSGYGVAGFSDAANGTGVYGRGTLWAGYFAGRVSVCSLEIRGGCDVAEPFQMSHQEIPKGSVVVIDDENAGQLKLSDRPYDSRVAGIVSGANGINPGIALHQDGALEGGQNVALSGRVYVRADASNGAITPGDLLTTSSTPGHAMKVTKHNQAQGAILGKAMSSLKQGKGMVLVLVTLQ